MIFECDKDTLFIHCPRPLIRGGHGIKRIVHNGVEIPTDRCCRVSLVIESGSLPRFEVEYYSGDSYADKMEVSDMGKGK